VSNCTESFVQEGGEEERPSYVVVNPYRHFKLLDFARKIVGHVHGQIKTRVGPSSADESPANNVVG